MPTGELGRGPSCDRDRGTVVASTPRRVVEVFDPEGPTPIVTVMGSGSPLFGWRAAIANGRLVVESAVAGDRVRLRSSRVRSSVGDAQSPEPPMGDLVLLCPAHHRLVHEGGFSIARLKTGGVEVRSPDGAVVREVPPSIPASVEGLRSITTARAVSAGTPIDEDTLRPWWDGRPPDLSACVAAGQRHAPPAALERG